VEAAAKLTDRETARTAYDLLKPYAHLPMIGSLAVTCFGSVEHALGVASLTMGKLEQGIAHLRRAVRANLALEHWPAACLSRFRLAQAIAMRGGEADLAEAAREQAAANHEASRLGMPLPSNQRIPAVTPEPVLSLQPPMLPDPDAGKTEDAGGTGAVDTSGGAETAEGETGITADDTLDLTEVIEEATQMTEAVASRGWASTEVEDQRADEIAGEGAQAELAGPGGSQIQLLGPLEVLVDGRPRPVLGHRRRTVLAILALHAGEIVSVDRLIDIVWGDRPPRTAVNTVQSHVSYLRRVIGDKGAILGRPPGYLLDLGPAGTDVATAEGLIRAGSRAADPAERVRHLIAALGLWRGRPLVDVTSSPWLDLQAERLNQLLLQAHQMLAEARLALGETSLLTVELRPLIREHPLAERLHGYLMLALYREGRQGEALEVYQRLRAVLSSELGVEPTEPLRTLQLAILRQDPVVPVI
jgi:DNA-binding SARP family transcriptional activator